MIKLDKLTVQDFKSRGVKKIKVFFYSGGCSGTKVDITENFRVEDAVICLYPSSLKGPEQYPFEIYVERDDYEKFENAVITRLVKPDPENPHLTGKNPKYIYSNEKVADRCDCGTSFSFEKKQPKINLEKLKTLKIDIKK